MSDLAQPLPSAVACSVLQEGAAVRIERCHLAAHWPRGLVLLRDGYYRDDDSKGPIGRPARDLVQSVDPATEGSPCDAEDHQPCKLREFVRYRVAERGETMERDVIHVAACENPTRFQESRPSGIGRFAPWEQPRGH